VLESVSAATDLDLISYLKAIPDARMRRGVRIPAWYLLLVAVLGILSRCQSMRDLERFAIRHHSVLTAALGIELRRPPSNSAFRYFFQHVDVAALCTAIRDTQLHEDAHRYRGKGAGAMATLRTAALNLLRLAGFQSIRGGMQAVMHDITALLAMARRRPQPDPC
jgi:hypothetical protein